MADIINWICKLLPILPLLLSLSSLQLFCTPPMWVREVAFLLHCHSHHHQSANCSAWERTSLHVVGPCLHPAFSRSLPTSHARSSTSLTFTPHLPCHSSSSLSSSLRAVHPPPFSTTLFTPLTSSLSRSYVNWFSLCVMQMFGLGSVAFPDGIHFAFHETDSDGEFLWIMLLCLWSMACCCYESWMSSDKKQKQSVKEFGKKKKNELEIEVGPGLDKVRASVKKLT